MTLAGLLFFLLQTGSGLFIIRFLDPEKRFPVGLRWVISASSGLLVSGYAVLAMALAVHSLPAGIAITAFVYVCGFAVFFWYQKTKQGWKRPAFSVSGSTLVSLHGIVVLACIAIILALEAVAVLPETLFVQSTLIGWGDIALHLGIIEHLATVEPFRVTHPYLAGHTLTYPFIGNFLSSIYRALGMSVLPAYHLPVFVFGASSVLLIYYWMRIMSGARRRAAFLVILVLFGAGLGWWWLGEDLSLAYERGGWSEARYTLQTPPHEYTHLDNRTGGKPAGFDAPHNIVWIVPAVSFLAHQRSFPLGITVGITLLLGMHAYLLRPHFWRYGVLAGLLPLAHGHTFIAMAILFAGLLITHPQWWKSFFSFGAVTLLVAAPALAYLRSGVTDDSAVRLWWGWMTCVHTPPDWFTCSAPAPPGSDTSAVWFWLKNFGGVFIAWGVILLLSFKRKKMDEAFPSIRLSLASILLFLLPNLFLFQAWEFDNNKILFWWWIVAIGLIGTYLAQISRMRIRYAAAALLALIALPAGAVDVYARLANYRTQHYTYVGEAEIEAATWIREHLAPDARLIAGTDANNFVPMLTGRAVALGFEGWLWTEGADYLPQRRAVEALRTGDTAPACARGLRYVVADAGFYKSFPVEKATLEKSGSRIWSQETPYGIRELYELSCTTASGA